MKRYTDDGANGGTLGWLCYVSGEGTTFHETEHAAKEYAESEIAIDGDAVVIVARVKWVNA